MSQSASTWDTCIECCAITDIGMRRQNNQDSLVAMPAPDEQSWRQQGHLFMVADGMGAHAAGELASKLACDGIAHDYSKMLELDPALALQQSIATANAEIHKRGEAEAGFHGMGTTCSVLLLLGEGAIVGHVGDSRIYRQRDDRLEQLTFDHSLVWEVRAAGQMAAAAKNLPKNIITRSLGPNPQVQVDLEGPFAVRPGDTFLVCSDGLTGPINDAELGTMLRCLSPAAAARVLVDLANLRGGPDNISVIVVRVNGPPVATEVEAEPPQRGPAILQPLSWVVAGLSLVATIVLVMGGMLVPAALAGMGATVALVVALSQRGEPAAVAGDVVTVRPPLGRGPYVSIDCTPTREIIDELAKTSTQLRDAATEQHWQVEWPQFERLQAEAQQAAGADDLDRAVRAYSESISLIIDDLRRRRGELKRAHESDVDLV